MPSTVIPALRYRDAHKAIDFLVEAFGFARHAVYESEGGAVVEHAQLTHGAGMIMLGSERPGEDDYGRHVTAGSGSSIGIYVVVDDVAAHAQRARAAGAEIVMDPEEQDYGGSNYTCKDLEGIVWSFGNYDPWAEASG